MKNCNSCQVVCGLREVAGRVTRSVPEARERFTRSGTEDALALQALHRLRQQVWSEYALTSCSDEEPDNEAQIARSITYLEAFHQANLAHARHVASEQETRTLRVHGAFDVGIAEATVLATEESCQMSRMLPEATEAPTDDNICYSPFAEHAIKQLDVLRTRYPNANESPSGK